MNIIISSQTCGTTGLVFGSGSYPTNGLGIHQVRSRFEEVKVG